MLLRWSKQLNTQIMNLPFHGSDVRTHKIEGITITVNIVLLDNKLMESMQPTDFEDCDVNKMQHSKPKYSISGKHCTEK